MLFLPAIICHTLALVIQQQYQTFSLSVLVVRQLRIALTKRLVKCIRHISHVNQIHYSVYVIGGSS